MYINILFIYNGMLINYILIYVYIKKQFKH